MGIYGESDMPRLRRARTSRALFVVAVLVLVGGALIGAGGTAAGPAFSLTSPIMYAGTNTCTGETFTGTGTLHFLTTENLSAGGVIESHLNVRVDGLQAVTATGKKYVVQDALNHEFVIHGVGAEDTFDMTAHFVRVGEDGTFVLGDDFYEYLRAHITANAKGMVTAFYVNTSDSPCQ
jgi:hypothetical protein